MGNGAAPASHHAGRVQFGTVPDWITAGTTLLAFIAAAVAVYFTWKALEQAREAASAARDQPDAAAQQADEARNQTQLAQESAKRGQENANWERTASERLRADSMRARIDQLAPRVWAKATPGRSVSDRRFLTWLPEHEWKNEGLAGYTVHWRDVPEDKEWPEDSEDRLRYYLTIEFHNYGEELADLYLESGPMETCAAGNRAIGW